MNNNTKFNPLQFGSLTAFMLRILTLHFLTMRMQLLSTLVCIRPPRLCPWSAGGEVSVPVLVCIFSCWLLRSSAIRFNTNSRSWQTSKHKTMFCHSHYWRLGFKPTSNSWLLSQHSSDKSLAPDGTADLYFFLSLCSGFLDNALSLLLFKVTLVLFDAGLDGERLRGRGAWLHWSQYK